MLITNCRSVLTPFILSHGSVCVRQSPIWPSDCPNFSVLRGGCLNLTRETCHGVLHRGLTTHKLFILFVRLGLKSHWTTTFRVLILDQLEFGEQPANRFRSEGALVSTANVRIFSGWSKATAGISVRFSHDQVLVSEPLNETDKER